MKFWVLSRTEESFRSSLDNHFSGTDVAEPSQSGDLRTLLAVLRDWGNAGSSSFLWLFVALSAAAASQ